MIQHTQIQQAERKVRTFALSPGFLESFKDKDPPWGPLGKFTFARTYARKKCACLTECSHPVEEWWETVKRVVEGVYNIQKIHCKSLNLLWQEPKAQQSAQEMYRRMWSFKFLPPGRGLWAMGTDVIYEKGSAALLNCFAGDTEIITAGGVKQIGPLAGTTQTLLTTGGKWIEAPIRSFGTQRLYALTLSRQGVDKTIFCTADHRWFARDRRQTYRDQGFVEFKTTELRPEVHHLQYVFGQGIKGAVTASPFGVAHGFSFGDGSTVQGERNANVTPLIGDKDTALAPYFAMCPSTPRPDGISYGAMPNFFKQPPSIHENKSYLLGWLMGYFAADGSVSNGQVVISSAARSNIEFVRDVCAVLGIGCYSIQPDTRTSNLTGKSHTLYRMTLMRDTLGPEFFLITSHRDSYNVAGGDDVAKRNWTVKHVQPTDRYEEVFCATVPEYRAFALDGNILTGNCAFTSTQDIDVDFAAPFCYLMDLSMLGVGVGGDTRGSGKVRIQTPRITDKVFVVEDSREGWVDLVRTILNSFVGRGYYPTAIDFSKVRPRGTPIKTFGGIASGPGPLYDMVLSITRLLLPAGVQVTASNLINDDTKEVMLGTVHFEGEGDAYRLTSAGIVDIFNYIGKCVVAGGVRRTAEIMFGEPDDPEFVALKQDKDALMDRRWASNNSVFGRIGMDYSKIAESVAINGEPGIMWLDNARKYSRMNGVVDNKDARVMGTNPCITGDTLTPTAEGPRRADKLIGKPFQAIIDGKSYVCKTGFFQTGVKPVYLLTTEEGHSLRLTADHLLKFVPKITRKKRYEQWVEASELAPGDLIALNDLREVESWGGPGTFEEGWLLGSLLGDGYFAKDQATAKVQFWGNTRHQMLDVALHRIATLGGDPRYHKMREGTEVEDRQMASTGSRRLYALANEYGISLDKEIVSDFLLTASSDLQSGFLRGLFDADGSVQGTQDKGVSIRLTSVNRQHLQIAQRMLMHLGINSTIYLDRKPEGEALLPNGKGSTALYPTQSAHELIIANDNLAEFNRRIGFDDPDKQNALKTVLSAYQRTLNRERFVACVKSFTFVGVEPVYDCTIEEIHCFGANGIIAHNCGEQPLEDREGCNLVETFPAHHDSIDDFKKTLKYAYLYSKSVTLLPTHDPRANAVMMRNRRIGCSMSGIVQAMQKLGRRQFLQWCDDGYNYIQELDHLYSEWLCVPHSVKTTSVKPSGTVSLLCGATPGIHYPHSQFYIRNVRIQNTSPLVEACRRAGYPVEQDAYAPDTAVVSFPVEEKNFTKGKGEVTVWEQFALAADIQRYWADNQVSVTVTFKGSEAKDVQACLETFEDKLKSISLLPLGDEDHGYVQAPYIEITREKYAELASQITPIDFSGITHEVTDSFCNNDTCTLKNPSAAQPVL